MSETVPGVPYYLRPDISKGITTKVSAETIDFAVEIIYDLTYQKGLRHCKKLFFHLDQRIIYDLTYQKGLRQMQFTLVMVLKAYYLRPDISKGITTLDVDVTPSTLALHYLRPDISKGITTTLLAHPPLPHPELSTTWHIKRDYDFYLHIQSHYLGIGIIYDLTYQKGLRQITTAMSHTLELYYLRPDISKGITTCSFCQLFSGGVFIIYDLTYQKGLRLKCTYRFPYSSTPIIYDLTYQKGLRLYNGTINFFIICANYLRPDISKGITTN